MTGEFNLGWIAGFLEGEGCFYTLRHSRGKYLYPRITAKQVQKWPLVRLQKACGGRIYVSPGARPGHSTIHTWVLGNSESLALMKLLSQHMSPKRQGQIERVLRECSVYGNKQG